jgi:pimeloyl-ACP methyl ester carboxylesterase
MGAGARVNQRRGQIESKWTVVGGLPMHARVSVEPVPAGSPAIVLVHGLGVASRYMVPTAERLASVYRVYAPDLPDSARAVSRNMCCAFPSWPTHLLVGRRRRS